MTVLRRAWSATTLLVLLLTAACSGAGESTRPASGAGSPAPSGASQSPAPTSASGADQPTVTLAFAGDVHFERQIAPLLDDSAEEWADRLPLLRDADLAVVNLETALGKGGSPEPKTYTFRAPVSALGSLAAAGVDVVSMANNHAADYGSAVLEQTLEAKQDAPLAVVGIGRDEKEAFAPTTRDVHGLKVAVLGSTGIAEETAHNFAAGPDSAGVATHLRRDRLVAATRSAAASHDLVVAFLHWGTEGSTCPNEDQRATARELEEAGADIVVGTHAHRPQGSGWLSTAFVGYGLGNHVWYNTSAESRSSGVLTVTVDTATARGPGHDRPAVTDYTWTPQLISASDGLPETAVESKERLEGLADAATRCADLRQEPAGVSG